MSILANIASRAAEKGLDFVVAGGHAVIVHGHLRNTFDLDVVIPRDDRSKWTELAKALGYSFHSEGPTFLQFDPPHDKPALPLDLMMVSADTFAKLSTDAVPASASAAGAKVVSLHHLLALKCHAIKHGHPGRIVKDADDVLRLVQVNSLDPNDSVIRELFLKQEQKNSMKKSKESVENADSAKLEFPDWSRMDDSSGRIDTDTALRLCELYPEWYPQLAEKVRSAERRKCTVEFVL